jgi:hypothetical protein
VNTKKEIQYCIEIYSIDHNSLTFFVERVFAPRLHRNFSMRTRRRGKSSATQTTGCKKKSLNLYTLHTTWIIILYIVLDLAISVQILEPAGPAWVLSRRVPGGEALSLRAAGSLRRWPAGGGNEEGVCSQPRRRWPAVEATVRRAPTIQHYSNRGTRMPCEAAAAAARSATAPRTVPGVWHRAITTRHLPAGLERLEPLFPAGLHAPCVPNRY